MGFGSRGFQGYAYNYPAKSCVNSTCRTTGNINCTTKVLTGVSYSTTDSTTTNQTMTLTSINLVSNADNSYMITPIPASPYVYLFSFTGVNPGNWHTTITLTNTNTSETYDFNYNTTESLTTVFAIPTLDSSNPGITTQQTYNGNTTNNTTNTYYTINQGTYSLTVNFDPSIGLGTATFDSVSINSNNVPIQNITIQSITNNS